jgi:hypothetical protein
MQLNLKNGIDKLLFGMKQSDVIAIYGKPNKSYKDEDKNVIFAYNNQKITLTFYEEEDLRLGYIIGSNPDLTVFGKVIIGRKIEEVKTELACHGLLKLTKEDFDTFENHFNEDHWLILQTEFDEVIKVEIGAIINNKDEFDWKFGKK